MKGVRPKQLVHRGVVQAHGVFFDFGLYPETVARLRVLEQLGPGDRVYRCEQGLVLRFSQARWRSCAQSSGAALVRQQELLCAAPLATDELKALDASRGSIVLVQAGAAKVLDAASVSSQDPAEWLDLSGFSFQCLQQPLGKVLEAPRVAVPAVSQDVRKLLGLPAPSKASETFSEALAVAAQGAVGGVAIVSSVLVGVASIVGAIGAIFAALLPFGGGASRTAPALPERGYSSEPRRPSGPSWMDRLRAWAGGLFAQLAIQTRLAGLLGRRHAEYLMRLLQLLDGADLDEALRHAIPLGGKLDGLLGSISLSLPGPRSSFQIAPFERSGVVSLLPYGGDVYQTLQARYRRLFERLEAAGQYDKAAFVLAELLNQNEEAVAFLERHGQLHLAAELAEGRKLPVGLVVRQWFLAGDWKRAVRIARREGAFADAALRLERTHPEQAKALRMLWADTLASSGAYAAAVDVLWPGADQRALLLEWIERAIAVGGSVGAKMLSRKARLSSDHFASVRQQFLQWFRPCESERLLELMAFGEDLLSDAPTPHNRVLARACARALVPFARDKAAAGAHAQQAAQLFDRLVGFSQDDALRVDTRFFVEKAPVAALSATVWCAAKTDPGRDRRLNEDAVLVQVAEQPSLTDISSGVQLPQGEGVLGMNLGVFDGCGGAASGSAACEITIEVLRRQLHASRIDSMSSEHQVAARVRNALVDASRQVLSDATDNPLHRGMGCTATVASIAGSTLLIGQVGDSRAYLLRDAQLVQLTQDHTLVNELLKAGELQPEAVKDYPHGSVITRALGVSGSVEPDLYRVPLASQDVLLLCSDGLHAVVPEIEISSILSSTRDVTTACNHLISIAHAHGAPDNIAVVVARFELASQGTSVAKPDPVQAEPLALDSLPSLTPTRPSAPWCPVIRRSLATAGALEVHDAVALGNGKLLLALGELGVRLVSAQGRTLVHFAQPAHQLVLSDHGDRAIGLASRGEAWQLTRFDLVGRRVQPWCSARFRTFAPTFDGAVWFVGTDEMVHAIDVLDSQWESLWSTDIRAEAIRWEPDTVSIWGKAGRLDKSTSGWIYGVPGQVLRKRVRVPDAKAQWELATLSPSGLVAAWHGDEENPQGIARSLKAGEWKAWAGESLTIPPRPEVSDPWLVFAQLEPEGVGISVFHEQLNCQQLYLHLEGAGRVGIRLQHDLLTVCDNRGRVLVLDLPSKKVLWEHQAG